VTNINAVAGRKVSSGKCWYAQIAQKEASWNFKANGSGAAAYSEVRTVMLTPQYIVLAAELFNNLKGGACLF